MVAAIAALVLTAFPDATVSAAYQDFYAMRAQGQECRYLYADAQQEPVAKFVAVLASREPLIDFCIPVRVSDKLLRLNLTALRWSTADWSKVAGCPSNPYTANVDQLIVPAGFFIDRVTDQTRSDAYFRLLFGGDKIPKTLTEFLSAAGGIDRKKQRGLEQLHVEANSGVNVTPNAARLVEFVDGLHAFAFETYDTKAPGPGADPLEQLDRNFKFDGIECFVLVPKVSTTGVRGFFPVTALANAKEEIVAEAPVDLVIDKQQTGGFPSIRNPSSCIGCHAASQPLTLNALRDRLSRGVELLTYDKRRQVEIELKHLATMQAGLTAWDTGFAAALSVVNGLSPEQNSLAFSVTVANYRADVTVATAAADLFCTPAELRLSLGYASAHKLYMSNRLAGLAHDVPLPRSSFESEYLRANEILCTWRRANQ